MEQGDAAAGPLYGQVRERLRARCARGEYAVGERLPPEAALAAEFGVSLITLRRAVSDLVAEGWLTRRQGLGTFVRQPRIEHELLHLTDFDEDMRRAGVESATRVLARRTVTAPDPVAALLALPPGTPIVELDRLRLAGGAPVAFDRTWLPAPAAASLAGADLARRTVYDLLSECGLAPVAGRQDFDAAVADPALAAWLAVAPGAPLLVVERVLFGVDGAPLYAQRRYYRPDRVRYRLALRRPGAPEARQGVAALGPVATAASPGGER